MQTAGGELSTKKCASMGMWVRLAGPPDTLMGDNTKFLRGQCIEVNSGRRSARDRHVYVHFSDIST